MENLIPSGPDKQLDQNEESTQSAVKLRNIGKKVLIVTTSHTGNNVFCTPAIRLLKKHYPDTHFNVAALNKLSAQVFEGNRDINQLYVTKRQKPFNRIANDHDHVISLNRKSNYLLEQTQKPHFKAPRWHSDAHHAEQTLQFVADYVGCQVDDQDRAYVLEAVADVNASPLQNYAVAEQDLLIGMHLGVGRTAIHGWKFFYPKRATHPKRWQLEEYIRLGQQLQHRDASIRIVLTGTRNEAFLGKKFAREVPGTINLMGRTSATDLVQLMNQLHLFISQDSGVLHIASATQVPLIALYGPTNPKKTGPFPLKPQHILLKKESMDAIKVSAVVDAAIQLTRQFPPTAILPKP